MPTARHLPSALCVKQNPDVVLVVGGDYTNAELLYGDASKAGQPWRWRQLSPMHATPEKPGMLLLNDDEEIQRILVAGGWRSTAELLTIVCTDTSDRCQWTLIAPLSQRMNETNLVWFNGCIFALCSFQVCFLLTSIIKITKDLSLN